jgi:hypothetical protein
VVSGRRAGGLKILGEGALCWVRDWRSVVMFRRTLVESAVGDFPDGDGLNVGLVALNGAPRSAPVGEDVSDFGPGVGESAPWRYHVRSRFKLVRVGDRGRTRSGQRRRVSHRTGGSAGGRVLARLPGRLQPFPLHSGQSNIPWMQRPPLCGTVLLGGSARPERPVWDRAANVGSTEGRPMSHVRARPCGLPVFRLAR